MGLRIENVVDVNPGGYPMPSHALYSVLRTPIQAERIASVIADSDAWQGVP